MKIGKLLNENNTINVVFPHHLCVADKLKVKLVYFKFLMVDLFISVQDIMYFLGPEKMGRRWWLYCIRGNTVYIM